MSAFWKHYATVTDDIRHKLVEEGWFGRQVTGDTTQQMYPGAGDKAAPETTEGNSYPLYEQTWGKAATHADIYGATPATKGGPTIEPSATPAQEHGPEPEV